jgi:Stage II sporulation protein
MLSILFLMGCIISQPAFASPLFFDPPSQIVVHIYRLTYPSGALWTDPNDGSHHTCSSSDKYFGCTEFDSDSSRYLPDQQRSYPYSTNPVTMSIESDYLLDVVPQEMATYYHPTAIQAQAIAARTYAFYHIDQESTINNSTQFQVFIPYKFEGLPPVNDPDNLTAPCASSNLNDNQRIVCDAVPESDVGWRRSLPCGRG